MKSLIWLMYIFNILLPANLKKERMIFQRKIPVYQKVVQNLKSALYVFV